MARWPASLGCTESLSPLAGNQPVVSTKYTFASPAELRACTAACVSAEYRPMNVRSASTVARGYLARISWRNVVYFAWKSGPDFQARYISLLQEIRAKYPRATVLALRTVIGRSSAETQAAVQARNAAGDANVHFVDTTGWLPASGLSDSVHPNDAGHRAIADRLGPVLASHLGSTVPATRTVALVNRNSGKVLAPTGGSVADGAAVVQQTDTGSPSHRWDAGDAGGGYVRLVNRASGKVLDVTGRSTADGAAVVQYRDTGGTNQQWRLVDAGNGYVTIVSRNSDKVLDVTGRSTAEGAPVIQWSDNGGTNQQWATPAR